MPRQRQITEIQTMIRIFASFLVLRINSLKAEWKTVILAVVILNNEAFAVQLVLCYKRDIMMSSAISYMMAVLWDTLKHICENEYRMSLYTVLVTTGSLSKEV